MFNVGVRWFVFLTTIGTPALVVVKLGGALFPWRWVFAPWLTLAIVGGLFIAWVVHTERIPFEDKPHA